MIGRWSHKKVGDDESEREGQLKYEKGEECSGTARINSVEKVFFSLE
jgi:hypothetical protein